MNATLAARLARLATSALSGRRVVQPLPVQEQKQEVPPDAIAAARATAEAFARRMHELAETRRIFDAATEAARKSGDLDLAGMLAIDPAAPLPDFGEIADNATKAGVRVRALKALADREAEAASLALLTLRRAAGGNIRQAKGVALERVRAAMPAGLFSAADVEAMAARSLPVRECVSAAADVEKLAAVGLPLVNAELFGKALGFYRLDPLPTAESGGLPPRDAFNPLSVAAGIRRALAVWLASIGFWQAMASDPANATWEVLP